MIKYAAWLRPPGLSETAPEAARTTKRKCILKLLPILFEEPFLSFSSNKL